MRELARFGQFSSRSDLEVGAKALEAGIYGSHRNVLINLNDIEDQTFRVDLEARSAALLERSRSMLAEIQEITAARTGDV
jgi:glutamate formiminotransferase / formiminotetrahydrofolate cyclodeaminase